EQQVWDFNDWGVPTVCINAGTSLQEGKKPKKILRGEYQVVISSPETFFATNKLRQVVVAPELSDRQHFVVVDEAHVIHIWGEEFRKEYGNVGNLHAMLWGTPFAAVTATVTEPVKREIIDALHLGSRQELVVKNLGNYCNNIEYSIYRITGRLTSYKEITNLFPLAKEVVPSLVFTNAIPETQKITTVLRDHLGWVGESAQKMIAYHSLGEESSK
ncbi:ATP-dependent DNA helicase sgs1, partial [Ceratobasidium sp. 370]